MIIEPKKPSKSNYLTPAVIALKSRLDHFIEGKRHIMNRWVKNELLYDGISSESVRWRFEKLFHIQETEVVNESGEIQIEQMKVQYTKESEYGPYIFNKRCIPTKVSEYIDDIVSRDLDADVTSLYLDTRTLDLVTKIIKTSLINDTTWQTSKEKVIRDILVKGNGMMRNDSYDLIRRINKKKKYSKRNIEWGEKIDIPYKRGTYSSYVDPECVFTEPNTKNPTEFFVGTPYTYGELLLHFPELEKNIIPPSSSRFSFAKKSNITVDYPINATSPFNYNLAEKIKTVYENYDNAEFLRLNNIKYLSSNNNWFDNVFTKTEWYNSFFREDYYWVWEYYSLAYNPNDEKSGDYCCIFIDNYELYSGPIIQPDKDFPVVNFKFNKESVYWSRSMVDDLFSIQRDINRKENIKSRQGDLLSTANLATNKDFTKNEFILDPFRVNVLDLETKQDEDIASRIEGIDKPMSVSNLIQPLLLGNPNAIEINNGEINSLLMQMEELYPKPFSKLQPQPEQNQVMSSYSPTMKLYNIINNFSEGLGILGEKFIKESVVALEYFAQDNPNKEINIFNTNITVVENESEKMLHKAKKLLIEFTRRNNEMQKMQAIEQAKQSAAEDANNPNLDENTRMLAAQQAQQPNVEIAQENLMKEEDVKSVTKNTAPAVIREIEKGGIKDDTIYFVKDNMVLLGSEGLKINIRFNKTKEEIIRDTMSFIDAIQKTGAFIDVNPLASRLATLYDQDLSVLLADGPDPIIQQMFQKNAFRVNTLVYPSDPASEAILTKLLKIDPKDMEFIPEESANFQKFLLTEKVKADLLKEVQADREQKKATSQTMGQIVKDDIKNRGDIKDIGIVPPKENPTGVTNTQELNAGETGGIEIPNIEVGM